MSVKDLIAAMPAPEVKDGVAVNAKEMMLAALEKQGVTKESYLAFQEATKQVVAKITAAGAKIVRTIVKHQTGKILTIKVKKGPGRMRSIRVGSKYTALLHKAPVDWHLPNCEKMNPMGDLKASRKAICAQFKSQ